MSRQRFEERGGGRAAKQHQQRHLYLLFDDWAEGYSVRMLDLSSDDAASDDAHGWQIDPRISGVFVVEGGTACAGDHFLPPAIFRFKAQRGLPAHFAAAFDSNILATQPVSPAAAPPPSVFERHVPVFDVRHRSCLFGPRPEPDRADPIYIPAGGRLFALAAGTFDVLYGVYPAPPLRGEEAAAWSWRQLPAPPFKRRRVASYAMHPDGHTVFVSIIRKRASAAAATFAFDTAESALRDGGGWRRRGKWALPFAGRAYFDAELDAWVGLSRDPDSVGHVCCCDAVPANPNPDGEVRCPVRKLSKEKLFSVDPTERHIGATLVYMGGRSEFCLVECVSVFIEDERHGDDCADEDTSDWEDDDGSSGDGRDNCMQQDEQDVSRPRLYLFRLITFYLKYDKNADLTTGTSCRVRYYRVPKDSTEALLSNPVAFWM
ncbi:unnamed protein product [Urochloa decumbens]|uniref:DUF1618 domain-containing protein n=1 Tax=Urochloa decumbens TaxID=240449 RepID=A0ABC8YJL9_9POAL